MDIVCLENLLSPFVKDLKFVENNSLVKWAEYIIGVSVRIVIAIAWAA
jgi:hypothetical protein